jgi:hypothetical protein
MSLGAAARYLSPNHFSEKKYWKPVCMTPTKHRHANSGAKYHTMSVLELGEYCWRVCHFAALLAAAAAVTNAVVLTSAITSQLKLRWCITAQKHQGCRTSHCAFIIMPAPRQQQRAQPNPP